MGDERRKEDEGEDEEEDWNYCVQKEIVKRKNSKLVTASSGSCD